MEQFKGQTRLPEFAIPERYDLHLKLDLSACTFSGTVVVDLSIVEVTKFLVLNALELNVHRVWFTNSHNQVINFCLGDYNFWFCLIKFVGVFSHGFCSFI